MSSLDELFGEALHRAAMPTTQERRTAVAEVTVHGARSKRRARAIGQRSAAIVAVGLAVGATYLVLGPNVTPANPAPSPTNEQPNVSPSPVVTAFADEDPRMPFAPPMDPEKWARVDSSWDVELAAFTNASDERGSTAQLFLTAPGEGREFAYGYPRFELTAPILLSFDPAKRAGFVFDDDSKTLNYVDFASGAVTEISNQMGGRLTSAAPMGSTAGGPDVFVLNTVSDAGIAEPLVFVMAEDAAQGVPVTGSNPSPVWGDQIVTEVDDGFVVTDVISGDSHPLSGHRDCDFLSWTLEGTFVALCKEAGSEALTAISIDPATGEAREVESNATSRDEFVASYYDHAIDSQRWWTGDATSGRKIFAPAVYWDEQISMLSTGFSVPADAYSVIFGIRD